MQPRRVALGLQPSAVSGSIHVSRTYGVPALITREPLTSRGFTTRSGFRHERTPIPESTRGTVFIHLRRAHRLFPFDRPISSRVPTRFTGQRHLTRRCSGLATLAAELHFVRHLDRSSRFSTPSVGAEFPQGGVTPLAWTSYSCESSGVPFSEVVGRRVPRALSGNPGTMRRHGSASVPPCHRLLRSAA